MTSPRSCGESDHGMARCHSPALASPPMRRRRRPLSAFPTSSTRPAAAPAGSALRTASGPAPVPILLLPGKMSRKSSNLLQASRVIYRAIVLCSAHLLQAPFRLVAFLVGRDSTGTCNDLLAGRYAVNNIGSSKGLRFTILLVSGVRNPRMRLGPSTTRWSRRAYRMYA